MTTLFLQETYLRINETYKVIYIFVNEFEIVDQVYTDLSVYINLQKGVANMEGTTLIEGVTAIFGVLKEGVGFVVKDVFVDTIIGQVFTQPVVWVGSAIGIGMGMLFKLKKPLK